MPDINESILCLASGANPSAGNSGDLDNFEASGCHVIVNISAFTSGSITVIIEGKDPVSSQYYTLLSSAALGAAATTVLRVFPGSTVTANLAANDCVPRIW